MRNLSMVVSAACFQIVKTCEDRSAVNRERLKKNKEKWNRKEKVVDEKQNSLFLGQETGAILGTGAGSNRHHTLTLPTGVAFAYSYF